MSAAPALFVVQHHVHDKEKWSEFFAKTVDKLRDKSPDEAASEVWCGSKVLFTACSEDGNKAICFWQLPAGSTNADCQEKVDMFTDRDPMVKNVVYPIDGSMGTQNLSYEMYFKDLQKLGKEGSVQGFAGNGELFFVHHNIPDKAAWDTMFSAKVEPLKDKSSSEDITEAWEVGNGRKAVMWCGLGDKDAMCLWSLPKGSTESDFQAFIDKFTGGTAKNDVFKIEPSNCIGGCILHPDFYAQQAIAFANSM